MALPCPLTSDYTWDGCATKSGGITKFYIVEREALLAAPTVVAGVVTAMSLAVGEQFRIYDIQKEISTVTDDWSTPKETGLTTYSPKLSFTVNSLATVLRQEIKLIGQHRTLIMFEDTNGITRLMGAKLGMLLLSGTANFGTLMADAQKQVLSFEGTEPDHMYEVTPGIIPALLIPAV